MTVNLSALAGAGQQFFDNVGVPLSGGKLYSYAAGTTTPQTTYTTAAGTIAHANPIILDSGGRIATGEIWLTAGSNYKFVLATSTNTILATWDNITGINGTGIAVNASNVQYDPAGTGAVSTTVQAKLRQTISVEDFGAVGNGSTDDTTAIQNALNAIASGGSLTGNLAKTYKIATALSISGLTNVVISDINFLGAGAADITSDSTYNILNILSSSNVTISKCSFLDCKGTSALTINNCDDVLIENCIFNEFSYAAIQIVGASERVHVSKNYITDCKSRTANSGNGYGVQISIDQLNASGRYPNFVWVDDNYISDIPNWDGINAHGGTNLFITNNKIVNVLNPIEISLVYFGTTNYLDNIIIDGNICSGATSDQGAATFEQGIQVVGDNSNNRLSNNIKITNNTVTGTALWKANPRGGIHVSQAQNFQVSGNYVQNNGLFGIYLETLVSDFKIYDNLVEDNQNAGLYLGFGYVKNGDVKGNRFYATAGAPFTQTYGISIGNLGSLDVCESENVFQNCTPYYSVTPYFSASKSANKPATGTYQVGDIVSSTSSYYGGATIWKALTRIETTLSASQTAGNNTVVVTSATGMNIGDIITIEEANGYYENFAITNIAGTTITLNGSIAQNAASGALIIVNSWSTTFSDLSGSATIAFPATTVSVVFGIAQPDINYKIFLSFSGVGGAPTVTPIYPTTILTTGFTVSVSSSLTSGSVSFYWKVQRDT